MVMVDTDLKIAVSRIHKLDGSGAVKAFCSVTILDCLEIKGFRVVDGKDGLFVSMPSEAGKDGKWYETVKPLKREIKDEIEKLVLEAFGG
jgi:stage V sporulation protein G